MTTDDHLKREVAMMTHTVKEFLAKEGGGGGEALVGGKATRKVKDDGDCDKS